MSVYPSLLVNFSAPPLWLPPNWLVWSGYAVLAAWFVYSRMAATPRTGGHKIEHPALAILLILHAPLAFFPMVSDPPFFGARESLALLTWIATAIYWVAASFIRLDGLQAIVLTVATVSFGGSLLLPAGHPTPWLRAPVMQVHFVIAMLSYGFLALAAGIAVLMRLADLALHKHKNALIRQLPPLLTLERMLFIAISLGFTLLTATLLSGILFSEQLFGQPLAWSHKTLFSFAAWLVFGGLLFGRMRRGWRGRIAINWTLAGFSLLVLAYIGSRFVFEVILRRAV